MSLHVRIRGDGPDLVLLHGWARHGGQWGAWLEELQPFARLHFVDLPGHGRSAWSAGIEDLADLARSVMPHVPPGAAVLGWSLGGLVAIELARQEPKRASALVLVATTPRFVAAQDWPHGMSPAVFDSFVRRCTLDPPGTMEMFLALQALGDSHARDTLRELRQGLDDRAPDVRALTVGLAMLRDSDLRAVLPDVSVPTLVIAGEGDRVVPAAAGAALAAALPSARLRRIARAGHAPFLSHGPEVARAIREFLTGADAPSRAAAIRA